MNSIARYAAVITGGLATGVALFVLPFVVLDFVFTRFAVKDYPGQPDLGDGVMVVGGGFLVGCSLGLAGLIFVLYRFWSGRTQRQPPSTSCEEAKS